MKGLMIYSPDIPDFVPSGVTQVVARQMLQKDKSRYSIPQQAPIFLIDVKLVTQDLLEFIAFAKVRGNRVIVHTLEPHIKPEQVLCEAMIITKIPYDILYSINSQLRVRDFSKGEVYYKEVAEEEGSFIPTATATTIISKLFN